MEDGNAIGEKFDFRQGVRDEQQGSIAARVEVGLQKAAKFRGGDGVEAAGGFVKQEHTRFMKKRANEAETLDGAGRKRTHLAIEGIAKMKLFRE